MTTARHSFLGPGGEMGILEMKAACMPKLGLVAHQDRSNYMLSIRDSLYIERHKEVESESMGKDIPCTK